MDENNYEQQKTNLFIIYEFERITFILTTLKLQEPGANASKKTKTRYVDWQWANATAHCYIFGRVANYSKK